MFEFAKRHKALVKTKKPSRQLFREELIIERFISITLSVLIFCAVFLSGIISINLYDKNLEKETEAEARTIMSDISGQISENVSTALDGWLRQLLLVNSAISTLNPSDEDYKDDLNELLVTVSDELVFETVGLILENGDLYYVEDEDGAHTAQYYNIATEGVASSVTLEGHRFVGRIHIFNEDKIIFGIPRETDGTSVQEDTASERISGYAGVISPDRLSRLLHSSAFDASSFMCLFEKDGNRVVDSYYGTEKAASTLNVYNYLSEAMTEEQYEEFDENYTSGKSSTVTLELNGTETVCYYAAFNQDEEQGFMPGDNWGNEWRIFIAVNRAVIFKNITYMLSITRTAIYILCGVISLLVLGFAINYCVYRSRYKQFLYIDTVTEGINEDRFKSDATVLLKRYPEKNYALVYCNIIHFSFVSERGTGRIELLKSVFTALTNSIGEGELVSRLTNDRFTMLLNFDNEARLKERLNTISNVVKSHCYDVVLLNLPFSMGVYIMPQGADISVGIDNAMLAQRSAGDDYNSPPVFFNEKMHTDMQKSIDLESKQEEALRDCQFRVFYQLKRDLKNDKWGGAEALVRWFTPDGNMISPGAFIPLFEKNGFILKLDVYIFETVCKNLREMLDKGLQPVTVSINLSRRHLFIEGFLDEYAKIMKKYSVPPELIELELTESMMFEGVQSFYEVVAGIHAMGCTCSIDDFGTGYSSLSMIKDFDFDIVKLDRSFFYGRGGFDEKTKRVVATLIRLSHDLGKKIVAEGIEEKEQVEFLKEAECDYIQGFYFAKPRSFEDNVKILGEAEEK